MSATIRYLSHSGFAVETGNRVLVFDYWKNTPKGAGLESGVVNPSALADVPTTAFVSHAHDDHFNKCILSWGDTIKDFSLVLSDDIPPVPGALMVAPNRSYELSGMSIQTLKSNDEGVAFLVDADGLLIFHAGDLNWWHWEGEPENENEEMGRSYREQIDLLKGRDIDIAFIPVDQRLESQYAWGADYFMRTVGAKNIFPMHFWQDFSVISRLISDDISNGWRRNIRRFSSRGEVVEV